MKKRWISLGLVFVLLCYLFLSFPSRPSVITIAFGSPVQAAGTADRTFNGNAAHDTAEMQGALNDLPTSGGRIVFLNTGNVTFNALITRSIPNVMISGIGYASYFARDGVNPVFAAGGANWRFENIQTDAGGITLLSDTLLVNVNGQTKLATLNATQLTATTGNFTTLNAPTGRGATYVIAAVNAPQWLKNQADYIVTTNASSTLQTAINALTIGRNKVEKVKLVGTFLLDTTINISSYTYLDMDEARIILSTDSNAFYSYNSSFIYFVGGEINGNRTAYSYGGNPHYNNGIMLNICSNVTIEGIQIHNFYGAPIHSDSGRSIIIKNNHLWDSLYTGIHNGLWSTQFSVLEATPNGANYRGSNNIIEGNFIWNVLDAVVVGANDNDSIINNVVWNTTANGLDIYGNGSKIKGNTITSANGTAIYVGQLTLTTDYGGNNIAISDNIIISPAAYGIYTTNSTASGLVVTNNLITGYGVAPLRIANINTAVIRGNQLGYLIPSQTFPLNGGAWASSVNGTGSLFQSVTRVSPRTGATANSTSIAYTQIEGISYNGNRNEISFSGPLRLHFTLSASSASNTTIRRVQLNTVQTAAGFTQQAEKGFGIKVGDGVNSPMNLYAESYGSTNNVTSLNTTLTADKNVMIDIIFVPGICIQYYINGILKVEVNNGTGLPSGASAGNIGLLVGANNGLLGGTNDSISINMVMISTDLGTIN